MINKTDILKMARSIFRRSQGYSDRKIIHPNREWLIGMGILLLVVGVGGVYNAQQHARYSTLESSVEYEPVTIQKYNQRAANTALDTYGNRTALFTSLIEQAPIENTASSTSTEEGRESDTQTPAVTVLHRYNDKVVYTDDMGADADDLRRDCEAELGGVFNTCGSVCPSEAEVCTEQCAYTCEFPNVELSF